MTEPAFIRAQRAFAQHLRNPDQMPAPADVPEERLAVYRYAVYHNIERFMADNFPRIKEVLPTPQWEALVRDYLVRHPATTPVFSRLPSEFVAFLEHTRDAREDPPYLLELAHFDWLENFVSIDEREVPAAGIDPEGDLLDGVIVVNPIHTLCTYRYPVHAINADFKPEAAPTLETHLVAFRDRSHQYGILDLNVISRDLFLAVRDGPQQTAREILRAFATRLGQPDAQPVIAGGLDILTRMRQRELILGTRAD